MLSVRQALVVVGCVSVGFVVSAGPRLVFRSSEPERWVGAVRPELTDAALKSAAQRRIVELERRVIELESEQRAVVERVTAQSLELSAAKARNEELADHNLALTLDNQQLSHRSSARAVCESPDDADPRAQLRYWALQMRDGERGFRGGLPPAWHAALNLMIRRERSLDPENPWDQPP